MRSTGYDELLHELADKETREEALRRLPNCEIRTAAAIAAPFLRDPDEMVRLAAAECLLERGSARYEKAVLSLLHDADPLVRVTAVECLTRWRRRAHWRRVARMLRDPDATVRGYAAWALKEMGAVGAIPKLKARVGRERNGIARAGMLEALIVMARDERYFPRLVKLLRHRDHQVRCFAANCLVGVAAVADEGMLRTTRAELSSAVLRESGAGTRQTLKKNLRMIPRA